MEKAFAWDEARIAILTEMIAGKFTAAVIAERLGTTRNAVLGKSNRLGIVAPDRPKRPPYVRKVKPDCRVYRRVTHNAKKMQAVATAEFVMRCVEIECLVPFSDVTGCRYTDGDGPFLFCDGPRQAGSSYCTPHFFLCREESRPRRDAMWTRDAA